SIVQSIPTNLDFLDKLLTTRMSCFNNGDEVGDREWFVKQILSVVEVCIKQSPELSVKGFQLLCGLNRERTIFEYIPMPLMDLLATRTRDIIDQVDANQFFFIVKFWGSFFTNLSLNDFTTSVNFGQLFSIVYVKMLMSEEEEVIANGEYFGFFSRCDATTMFALFKMTFTWMMSNDLPQKMGPIEQKLYNQIQMIKKDIYQSYHLLTNFFYLASYFVSYRELSDKEKTSAFVEFVVMLVTSSFQLNKTIFNHQFNTADDQSPECHLQKSMIDFYGGFISSSLWDPNAKNETDFVTFSKTYTPSDLAFLASVLKQIYMMIPFWKENYTLLRSIFSLFDKMIHGKSFIDIMLTMEPLSFIYQNPFCFVEQVSTRNPVEYMKTRAVFFKGVGVLFARVSSEIILPCLMKIMANPLTRLVDVTNILKTATTNSCVCITQAIATMENQLFQVPTTDPSSAEWGVVCKFIKAVSTNYTLRLFGKESTVPLRLFLKIAGVIVSFSKVAYTVAKSTQEPSALFFENVILVLQAGVALMGNSSFDFAVLSLYNDESFKLLAYSMYELLSAVHRFKDQYPKLQRVNAVYVATVARYVLVVQFPETHITSLISEAVSLMGSKKNEETGQGANAFSCILYLAYNHMNRIPYAKSLLGLLRQFVQQVMHYFITNILNGSQMSYFTNTVFSLMVLFPNEFMGIKDNLIQELCEPQDINLFISSFQDLIIQNTSNNKLNPKDAEKYNYDTRISMFKKTLKTISQHGVAF
ncbi:hypothetical protein EIN_030710, partial [Entamoeba invadens IP1]